MVEKGVLAVVNGQQGTLAHSTNGDKMDEERAGRALNLVLYMNRHVFTTNTQKYTKIHNT